MDEGLGARGFKLNSSGSLGLDWGDGSCITWTPKVCKIMASRAVIMGLGLLFYIFWGLRKPLMNCDGAVA